MGAGRPHSQANQDLHLGFTVSKESHRAFYSLNYCLGALRVAGALGVAAPGPVWATAR